MNLNLAAAAANPGTYSIPPESMWMSVIVVPLFFIGFFLILFAWTTPKTARAALIVSVIGLAVLVGASATTAVYFIVRNADASAARAAYNEDVSDWLADAYSIDAAPDRAAELVAGEAFATEYNGRAVTASIIYTASRDLALVDESRAPLAPLKR